MPRRTKKTLKALGIALVGLVAAAGLAVTGVYVLLGTSYGTSIIVPRVLTAVNGAIQGSVEIDSFRLRSHGTIEIRGLRIRDPEGQVVIAADRALARADVLLLRLRIVAVEAEIDRPSVLLARTEEGGFTIERAFRARRPSPEREEPPGESRWTVRLDSLAVRDGSVELTDPDGARRLGASGIDLDGSGAISPAGSEVQVRLTGDLLAPLEERLTLDGAASLEGGIARVSRLRASAGETALDAVGEWDLAAQSGRVAVGSFAVDAADLEEVIATSPLAGDVAGTLYADASGGVATFAFDLAQRGASGRAIGAAALRMSSPLSLGFDLDLKQLDPARVVAAAPAGEVTLHARGGLTGTDLATLNAALELEAAPSRLRDSRLGPVKLRGTARSGVYEVAALDAVVPGARLRGSGKYALRGAIGGSARLEASDLAAAARAVERLARISLPAMSGRAKLAAHVSGSVRAPRARFDLAAPRMSLEGLRASGLGLKGELGGSVARPRGRATGTAKTLSLGAEVIRQVDLAATIDDRAAEARITAVTLRIGPDPLTVTARGTLARNWRRVDLSALTVAWPGSEFALTAPARVEFAGPRVDRLELASGRTRVALEGGLARAPGPRRRSPPTTVADARLVAVGLDLATLPRELLPPALGIAGVVELDARVSGPLAAPEVVAHAEATDGAVSGIAGLSLVADAEWDGAVRRAGLKARVKRAKGGELEVRAELPAALTKAARTEPVEVWLRARGLPLDEAARLAGSPETISGSPETISVGGAADVDLILGGTVGDPALTARLALNEVRYGGYGPYRLDAALDAPGRAAKLDAAVASGDVRLVELAASVPFDLVRFLRDPARGALALLDAPLSGEATAPEFELTAFAGDFGLPADLAGRMRGGADLSGTLRAPRGSLALEGSGIVAYGYTDVALQLALLLSDDTTGVAGSIEVAKEEILQVSGFLGLPIERLTVASRIESAPMHVDLIVPDADLAQTGGRVPLAGHIDGRVRATGSLQKPSLELDLDGENVRISGQPLGRVVAKARAAGSALTADVRVDVASGGLLTGSLRSTTDVSFAAVRRGDIAHAPSELRLVADRVELGVLAALLPGTVRSASGELGADLAASGPLASLRPVGHIRVSNGRAAISDLGDWSEIEVDAALTADALKVVRLQARRGRGTLDAKAEARGLRGMSGPDAKPATFTAELETRSLTIPNAGQDIATLDLEASAKGTFDTRRLEGEVTIPRGTVELPERAPRDVQSLERRDDIVIVTELGRRRKAGRDGEAPSADEPYHATLRVLIPRRFFVTSSNPRMNIELQADATFDVIGSNTYAQGQVEVLRGYVEPIGGRNFTIERGRLTFTGAEPQDAVLDIVAEYENPSADVTVAITGTTKEPVVKMTSDPPMDEAQIAMLIATGRTELKAGSGSVGTLTGEEAGRAALGAVATQLFRNVVADRLPVDSVALSSSEIRAGKYVTDKIYVGYTRNFEAQPEQGENTNELRVEYQISPRWTLESRYGDARTGGASIIWSKDY